MLCWLLGHKYKVTENYKVDLNPTSSVTIQYMECERCQKKDRIINIEGKVHDIIANLKANNPEDTMPVTVASIEMIPSSDQMKNVADVISKWGDGLEEACPCQDPNYVSPVDKLPELPEKSKRYNPKRRRRSPNASRSQTTN